MMILVLIILCLVVSVERQVLSGSPNFNKKERKFSERICIQYVSVLAYGLHRGQNTGASALAPPRHRSVLQRLLVG
jgi:hypothetical protein